MKKLLLFAVLALTLSGCVKEGQQTNYGDRFTCTKKGSGFNVGMYIITDNQTQQEYLLVKAGYGCAMAPMQHQNNPK